MKVWMVSSGCYSDYHIVGVFSTEENAQKFVDAFPVARNSYDGLDIEEKTLDPYIEEINEGLTKYSVKLLRNGDVYECVADNSTYFGVTRVCKLGPFGGGNVCIIGDVWARDQQHAIKIMNERRGIAIAMGEFDKIKGEK